MKIRWLRRAKALLRAIHGYIAVENPRAAKQVVAGIQSATEQLAMFPNSGRAGTVSGTREVFVPNLPYLIVYRIRDDEVQILRVFHTSQDWPGLM